MLSVGFVWAFTIASAALFLLAAAMLNRLTLILAPVALACVLLYSFTKRWTQFSHLVLGACLSIAPTAHGSLCAARLAVRCHCCCHWWSCYGPRALTCCMPARITISIAARDCDRFRRAFGIADALWIARALHAAAFLALVWLFVTTELGPVAFIGVIATGALLVYQHRLVRADDLSRLNAAFFTTNAFVSVILLVTFGSAVFLQQIMSKRNEFFTRRKTERDCRAS